MRPRHSLRSHPGTSVAPGPDVALACALLTVGLLEAVVALDRVRPAALIIVLLMTVPLCWRRRHPVAVAIVVSTALAVQLPWAGLRLFDQTFTGFVALAVAVYSLGRHAPWPRGVQAAGLSAAIAGLVLGLHDGSVGSAVLAGALVAAPALVGHIVRSRIQLRSTLEEQAIRLAGARERAIRASAQETRGRIAAEVQEVVRRSVDEMVDRAREAQRLTVTSPLTAGAAIADVEACGRGALDDMRRMLGVLRADDASSLVAPPMPEQASSAAWPRGERAVHEQRGPGLMAAWVVDRLVTGALVVVAAVEAAVLTADSGAPATTLAAGLAGAMMAAPLLARRRHPLRATVLVWTGAVLMAMVFEAPLSVLVLIAPLLGHASGAYSRHTASWVGLLVSWVGVVCVNLSAGLTGWGDYVFPCVVVGLGWTAGRMLRDQSDLTKEVLARGHELDRAREAEIAAAATEERLRVARELHDVVAHSLIVMVVQAGAARRSLESGRPGCAEALRVVEETGTATLSELRRLLGLVDPAGSPAGSPPALPTDVPGMGHLAELIERTGLPVTLTIDGTPTSLAGGIDLAAYRIAQEALTNVMRHSRATRAWVRVGYAAERLDIEVRDDGVAAPDRPPQAPGNGITGMQERAGIYSGEVSAGPQPGGGFRVRASIPLRRARQGQPA